MKFKLQPLVILMWLMVSTSLCAQSRYFKNLSKVSKLRDQTTIQSYEFDISQLNNVLSQAPARYSRHTKNSPLVLEFPNLNGELERYKIEEASVMAPELQAKYPEIRSYVGYGIDTPSSFLRFSISPYKGLSGIVLSGEEGKGLVINSLRNDVSKFTVSKKAGLTNKESKFLCKTLNDINVSNSNTNKEVEKTTVSANAVNHEFDLAVSVTGEYALYHGDNLALVNAAIVTTITRVNGVFENDFNVTLLLVANNDEVVFLDPDTDPYESDTDDNYSPDLQTELDNTIGEDNYDVGHLLAGIGNNGLAGCIGCICIDGLKGSGFSTSTVPDGDTFDIDFVAHEIGHQFGANHTFSHRSEGGGVAQMEVGSGSTIMAYAGITGATDVQNNSDPYFHSVSIQQITNHVASRNCDVETAILNNIPSVDAGIDLILPVGTPFRLVGSASDADVSDTLTYCWEQFDENNGLGGGFPDPTSSDSNFPLFRSYLPSTLNTRTFPLFQDLLDFGVNGTAWEKIPTVARSAAFRLTVRDNKPGGAANSFDDMMVTWDATKGPFEVTSQNAESVMWTSGSTETINWNVNDTNTLIGAENVNILLSTDGGLTYPTVLATNVPNNGSADIEVPNLPAPYCRVMVQPTGAPFFSLNLVPFAIDFLVETVCTTYESEKNLNLTIPDSEGDNEQGVPLFNSINVTDTGVVDKINVSVDVSHNFISDLLIQVQDPLDAEFVNVWSRNCGSNEDINVTFDDATIPIVCATPTMGTYAPNSELAKFNGVNLNGDWQIVLVDFFTDDEGTLNSWAIEVCSTTETALSADVFSESNFTIFPNPNTGEFTVHLKSGSNQDIQVKVFDIGGRQIFNGAYRNSGAVNEVIKLNNVQSGMYLVKINDGLKSSTKKIIIE